MDGRPSRGFESHPVRHLSCLRAAATPTLRAGPCAHKNKALSDWPKGQSRFWHRWTSRPKAPGGGPMTGTQKVLPRFLRETGAVSGPDPGPAEPVRYPVHHPVFRAGARKLAPLPVWSCANATAPHVSPRSSKRTNRAHKLGLQVQNRKNSILWGAWEWKLDGRVRPGHDGEGGGVWAAPSGWPASNTTPLSTGP